MLCPSHVEGLRDQLRGILETWVLLPLFTTPGSVDDGNVRGKRIDAPAPIRLEVVALGDLRTVALHQGDPLPVAAMLQGWARIVREERRLPVPDVGATLLGEVLLLHTHHAWVCAQPWVDAYAGEVRECGAAVRAAIGEYAPRPVGRCPVVGQEGACGGPLHQDRWGGMGVSCRRCGAAWDQDDLRRLGLVMSA